MLLFGYYDYMAQCINIEISSLLLWPIVLLLSDALLYFYDNKHILILILLARENIEGMVWFFFSNWVCRCS